MKTTKQLARELGLLRKKTATNKTDKVLFPSQIFSFLVVLDFESTCWQDGKFRTQEIIEFPAVLLNTITGDIESEFQFYVQPQEQPVLSDFCKELTGITQEQVDNGIPLPLCVRKFVRWLDNLKETKGVVFSKTADTCKLATIVTWSDWDLGVCLYHECRRKQIVRPTQLNSWIDLRATYKKFYGRKPNGLNGALKDVGIDFEGREHSGLHDSRNTAILAFRMIKDGCIMNITKTLKGDNGNEGQKYLPVNSKKQLTPSKSPQHKRQKQIEDPEPPGDLHFDDDLNDVIANSQEIDILCQVTMETPERKRKSRIPVPSPRSGNSKSELKSSRPVKTIAKRILPGKFDPSDIYMDSEEPKDAFICRSSSSIKNVLVDISVNVPVQCKSQKHNAKNERNCPGQVEISNVSEQKTPPSDRRFNTSNQPQSSGHFKTPLSFGSHPVSSKQLSTTQSTGSGKPLNRSSSAMKTPSHKPNSFKTPSSVTLTTPSNSRTPLSGSFKTPSVIQLRTPSDSSVQCNKNSSGMMGTPPLCKCGKRSKRRMAQTPGPNLGRFFFTCGSSNYNSATSSNSGCGFFKWETTTGSRYQSFTQNGTLSKPFVPVFSKSTAVNSTLKKNLGVRSNSISSFR